ncbi:hypothetical protein ETH_00031830 [Eimeria tenella]|uniref:GCC2 and GCC3 domain-containing protein n=1 Tax=Eimeria tenella TaxID=5802 RepID=U6KXH7_EIMTE|nr:hypothetical protein ETH_00031830 [Eimeria tenella]CDJ42862.1 hypothetical protein ETH_00031830 [Eimeria tenella]|eukprot:XP_013233612.1 hypothetical protein ETH_00031830 [Eimeria tenella]
MQGTHAPSSGASVCDPCPTGYLCYGGTATSTPQLPHVDHGEPCPPGYYCPAGSSAPQPCPAGTYNDQKAGANLLEACKPCDPDTYSDTPGQTGCFACGSTSTASAGQTTCTCLGEHRWFQPSQGSCICEGGYESYDVAGTSFSNLDSSLDCQPIVRQNCAGSQIAQLATSQTELRDKDGLCVDPLDCESVCPDGKGLQDELNLSHRYLATGTTTEGVLRHLSAEATSLTVKAPVQCLQLYDSVVWWVGEGVYPIFLKDSLLNTNTEIDISAFLQLASSMGSRDMSRSFRNTRSTSSSLEYFVYTFTVEGVFAFGTSEDSSPQAIFSVVGEGIQCATGTRFPETATHSSLARIGAQLQQVLNVEPDLTISLLTFACLLVVLVLLLVSISAARRSQYKKRQALDRKDISERKDLVLGNRSAALTMRRRLESLLADLIEQRLCKQENNKVLALQPEQLESMLAEIPRGTLQPQAFENAFGVLHELSLQLNSFSSMASYEYHETTKDLAVEISRLQKEILITLAPVKQRLQHRDRLRGLMAPMMENINRLLGELRSTDLFISAAASGNDFEDSEEGEHAIIIRKLLIPANIGESTMLHLRLLHATVYAERFITQASDRFQVFSASERMVKACITTLKAQKTQTDGAADALAQEKLQLLQGAHNLLAEGCKLLASGRDAKESMKERFAEYRRREEDILNSCRRQYSAAIDAEVAIALQSLIDREDVLLQGHLSRLTSLAAAAQLPSAESRSNKQKAARALHSYSNECRAHFKQALKITTEALHKQLTTNLTNFAVTNPLKIYSYLMQPKSPEIRYAYSVMQAAVNGWTEALQSEIRTQAQTLRRQAKAGELEESEYRQQKASLASSLDLNIQRITREQFSSKAERIDQFEREATSAYESLMEATHKRQKLEDDLRKAQADVFGSLVRRRIKQFWRSAEEERKLLLNTIIASWSRAAANQERLFDVELKIQEELASAKLEEGEAGNGPAQLQRGLKERKQETEAAVEAMMDKSREFQGQSLKENLARMDELRREQEATMKEATNEAKCALSEQRELWLRALKGEADIDATTRGTLQAIGEQHAVRVAVSCLEAAAQQYYHDAAAEEKESAEVESLAVVDENEQMKQFKESLMERTALLKSSCDEEFHRSSDALWAAFQQHQEACKRARGNILDAQGQFQENRIAVDTWARETEEMLWHEATAPHVDEGTQERMCFAFSRFRSDWEEDLLTWQSGQINERFEASTIDDNRLKQQRGPDWAASCASSGSKALDSLQDNDAGHNSTGAQMALETPRVKLNDDFWARGKSLLDSISKSQREISLAESEWLGRCRAIQGGRTALNANEAKIKRAQTTRLEHMKEGFRR